VLEQATQGEDVGIVCGNQIVQLKPVEVVPWEESYVYQEYGVTPAGWNRFKKKMKVRRANGKYISFEGKFDPKNLL